MKPGPEPNETARADAFYADLLGAGEDPGRVRELFARRDPSDQLLVAVLRRAVPVRALEHLGTTPPWSERPLLLARVVLNPRSPRALALRLVSSLYWRDLAEVAAAPHVAAAVRARAEASLRDGLGDMRLGDRVALARVATQPVLAPLLLTPERKVADAAVLNPRLREADLLAALRRSDVPLCLIEAAAESSRWSQAYGVRLELVLQSRTPLPLALLQLSSLVPRDLQRVAQTQGLRPLLRLAAERLLETPAAVETSGDSER